MKYFSLLLTMLLSFAFSAKSQLSIKSYRGCNQDTLTATVVPPVDIGLYSDDNYSGLLNIGFTFNFYGTPYTQCIVGENGCLCFNSALAGGYNPWPISAPLLGNSSAYNSICGPWCDIDGAYSGSQPIYYSLTGTAPNRVMEITWCGVDMYSCWTQWITTQIKIFESTNIIEVHVAHKSICAGWNGGYAIIGVQNSTGTSATTAPGRDYPSVYTCTNEAWRFTPAGAAYNVAAIPYAPTAYATSSVFWYNNTTGAYLGTGDTIVVTPTAPTNYEALVVGCSDTATAFLTVSPPGCIKAVSNNTCQGGTVYLQGTTSVISATYLWTGPAGFTSTLQNTSIPSATPANSGMYVVTQTLPSGSSYSDTTYVTVFPTPVINISSNAPLCLGRSDTLLLGVTPDSVGEAFLWTGPSSFTSTLQYPDVPGFVLANVGIYQVVGTTVHGCSDSASVYAGLVPIPPAPGITGITQYCYGATPVPFVVTGSNILWYATDTSTVSTSTAPVVPTTTPGTYSYFATQTTGCMSPMDSIKVTVYPRIDPDFSYYINRGCTQDVVTFTNTSANSNSYRWDFGDGNSIADPGSALLTHTHVYVTQGLYNVTLTGFNAVCSGDTVIPVDTRHSVQAVFSASPDTMCLGTPTTITDNSLTTLDGVSGAGQITNYAWMFGDGNTSNVAAPGAYTYASPGIFAVTLTVTDSINCTSSVSHNVYVIQILANTVADTTLCISQPLPMKNAITQIPDLGLSDYTYTWTPADGLSDPNIQNPTFDAFGSFTYNVADVLLPYNCIATSSAIVNSVKGLPLTNVTASQTVLYGGSVQLNSDNEKLYYWVPNDGSLSNNNINNPIASPEHTTTYTVYGLDSFGCLDSSSVTLFVDTSVNQGIPTAFTPNGDNINDVFKPVGMRFQNIVDFRIFNRWGVQVFSTNNREVGWDGTYNGVPQDMGTYNYMIIVADPGGSNVTYRGNVTLIR